MSKKVSFQLKSGFTAINSTIAVPCTGCAYCVDGCPMNIAIQNTSHYIMQLQEVEKKDGATRRILQQLNKNIW